MKHLIAAGVALILAASSVAKTPEEVATEYYQFVKENDWSKLADLYDPGALKEFRETMSFLLKAPANIRTRLLAQFFGPEANVDSVSLLTDKQFFASFLNGVMTNAASLANFRVSRAEVLGSVAEGDDLRHVVTRTTLASGATDMEVLEILSLKASGDTWRALMQGKMRAMAEQIRSALQSTSK